LPEYKTFTLIYKLFGSFSIQLMYFPRIERVSFEKINSLAVLVLLFDCFHRATLFPLNDATVHRLSLQMKFTLTSLTFYLVRKNHRGNKGGQKVVKTPFAEIIRGTETRRDTEGGENPVRPALV
jgi:hypothetical protein